MEEKINVLIVDDEQIVLDSVERHLKKEGVYNVFTALSVKQALSIIDENRIDIALTDLMMPEIDGLGFLKIVKEKNEEIIAVMITGYATINTALQAQELGAFDYLAKPFTRKELMKIVKRAADLAKTSREKAAASENPAAVGAEKMPSSLKGIGEHSWLMIEEDGEVRIGVERPFLYSLGKLQSVYLPEVGDELRQGSVYFQAFSADLKSDSLLCPVSGIVTDVNKEVIDNPNKALEDPYGQGWLLKLSPTKFEEERKLLGL